MLGVRLRAVLAWAESDSVQANTAKSRENEYLRKTILACLTEAQMASIHEIKKYKKNLVTLPLLMPKGWQLLNIL